MMTFIRYNFAGGHWSTPLSPNETTQHCKLTNLQGKVEFLQKFRKIKLNFCHLPLLLKVIWYLWVAFFV